LSSFALALWVEGWAQRSAVTRARQLALGVALVVLTVLALFDQISPKTLPEYEKVKAQFINDGTFVREIEKNVPHGAMIFQLPVMSFPENPPVARMKDYDLLRGYLHSNHLRWSYGTIKGREGDIWLRQVASQPLDEMVETLAWAGFSGIYIDRNGYADNAVKIEKELYTALCDYQFFSPDEKLIFYNLKNYVNDCCSARRRVSGKRSVRRRSIRCWPSGKAAFPSWKARRMIVGVGVARMGEWR
jgi:phosphoglycerol transferase